MENNSQQAPIGKLEKANQSIVETLMVAAVGVVFGVIGYYLLESYFAFSSRQGLGGIFTFFFILASIVFASIFISIGVVFFTRTLPKRKLIIRSVIMVSVCGVVTLGFYFYYRVSLADQLPKIRSQAKSYSILGNTKKVSDCAKISEGYLWTSCVRERVRSADDFTTCRAQAKSIAGRDPLDCYVSRAIGAKDGRYCNAFDFEQYNSCASLILEDYYGDPRLSLQESIKICGQLEDVEAKTKCYIFIVREYSQGDNLASDPESQGESDPDQTTITGEQMRLFATQLPSYKEEICAGIDVKYLRNDVFYNDVKTHQDFCLD